MHAAHISAALVKPSAGMVDRSCGIRFSDQLRDAERIKLAPSFIKRNPHADTGMVVKPADHTQQIRLEAASGVGILPGQHPVVAVIAQMPSQSRNSCRQIGFQKLMYGAAPVDHILPDHHADTVTVPVPSFGLDLHMLAQHVKSKFLHLCNIKDQGLIRRGRHQALRPVSLVQHSMKEVGAAVEQQAGSAFFVCSHAEAAHGKIALNQILPSLNPKAVEDGIFRTPELRIINRDPHLHPVFPVENIALLTRFCRHLHAGPCRQQADRDLYLLFPGTFIGSDDFRISDSIRIFGGFRISDGFSVFGGFRISYSLRISAAIIFSAFSFGTSAEGKTQLYCLFLRKRCDLQVIQII